MKNETTLRRQLSVSEETTEASHQPLGALEELHRHWALFLSVGVALMALGIVATLTAGLSTIVAVDFFGWILVIAGAGVTIHGFWAKRWSGFFLQLLSGLLYLAAGWMLATHPELSAIALTLVIAISFVVQGAFRIGAALSTRIDGWGSLLASGIITLLLGLMIWNEWPLSGVWVIGVFVGIDMFFYGVWLVSLALSVRSLPRLGRHAERLAQITK
jgi:uncharacterized membrane protein HdeD (DUF308 family)